MRWLHDTINRVTPYNICIIDWYQNKAKHDEAQKASIIHPVASVKRADAMNLGTNANVIGIDHDTVCAGVVGTAIRNSTSCAGRRAAACGLAGRHNECCSGLQYQPRQRRPYKWSISILPRSQFYKKQGKLAFSTSCTAVRPHRRLRNDAWRPDS